MDRINRIRKKKGARWKKVETSQKERPEMECRTPNKECRMTKSASALRHSGFHIWYSLFDTAGWKCKKRGAMPARLNIRIV